ncbi:Hypothetical protein PFREUD_01820 [Propionibacterium freudenreichii subsp. shermanii CIRM-BIA1]|nr:Hypothetical protein PFREUD_01820 [Propionibacterium freudenreichii subsp. shermanii CIRM-BIA1]
MDQAFA